MVQKRIIDINGKYWIRGITPIKILKPSNYNIYVEYLEPSLRHPKGFKTWLARNQIWSREKEADKISELIHRFNEKVNKAIFPNNRVICMYCRLKKDIDLTKPKEMKDKFKEWVLEIHEIPTNNDIKFNIQRGYLLLCPKCKLLREEVKS